MTEGIAFVAGATGYTGRALVPKLAQAGVTTWAHVRPDSPRLAQWRDTFGAAGAEVDDTAWERSAMTARLSALQPTHVFALLGTTRARAATEGRGARDAYEQVDYGLTKLLLEAALACGSRPCFVYLSAAGVRPGTRNPYMAVRARIEAELAESDLPWISARPSFITGPDREENRAGERIGAKVADGALGLLGALGAKKLSSRYRSTDADTLAAGLMRAALEGRDGGRIVESEALR